jgi:adenylosuccinate lyase
MFDHETYLSPLTWRYGTERMRRIWSEAHKRALWRRIWVALAEAQAEFGLVTGEQVADLRAHAGDVNIDRTLEIEAEIQHDVMAEVKAFAEQCPVGGGIIHLGATSMDVEDNADALRLREALDLLLERLRALLSLLADTIEARSDQACMGFTHLQPAEPTTIGYRLAQYALDLLIDLGELQRVRDGTRGKGLKGATGTSASYTQLLTASPHSSPQAGAQPLGAARDLEAKVMDRLKLRAFPVATQTYPRKQDWLILNAVAGLAGSLYKFAFDLRILQSQPYGEWSEPFGSRQVGSSAMPFKRNPIHAENLDSLARVVVALPRVAWDDAAHSLLERTLDDKANRRMILPQAFLVGEELIRRAHRILAGLIIHEGAVAHNLAVYGTFAATERLLMELVKAGADRQEMHELIRRHSLAAWDAIQHDAAGLNPLSEQLSADPMVLSFMPAERVRALLDAEGYVGDAPERAQELAKTLRKAVAESAGPSAQLRVGYDAPHPGR